MMNRLSALLFALALAGGCAPAPAPAAARDPATGAFAPPTAEAVENALAAVVLLVSARADGSVAYGSGIVLDGRGLVVTNAHVLAGSRSLRAMLYDPRRVSYTPMDGGLARYLFEYEKDLVGARVERLDAASDLALLRLDADTSGRARLRAASAPPRRGERVFAIGHPQENVWSFTAGQVSALHHGAVQHDALLSFGSSGGPLLNERGELVGVNTSKVVSEPRGLSFARPVALVDALVRASGAPGELDLSTPERAAKACWLAREIASPGAPDCFDWDTAYRAALARGAPGDATPARERWVSAHKGELRRRAPAADGCLAGPGAPAPQQRALGGDVLSAEGPASKRGPEAAAALPAEARADAATSRRGARVEEVRTFGEGLAWVRLEARTAEGSRGLSELYARVGGRWLRRTPPSPDELRALPEGWPPPRDDLEPGDPGRACPLRRAIPRPRRPP